MSQNFRYDDDGFCVMRGALNDGNLADIRSGLLDVGEIIGGKRYSHLDEMWSHTCSVDRVKAGFIYNGFKLLPAIQRLVGDRDFNSALRENFGLRLPALLDINCRIDSWDGDRFLFDWHQDYWFSVSSPRALVLWIPLTAVSRDTGGLAMISNRVTGGRIFRSRKGDQYNSYADAIKIDETVPEYSAVHLTDLTPGDVIGFKFNVLHKSLPVLTKERSRFTLQLRFADFKDSIFFGNEFKSGRVTQAGADYLSKSEV